MGKHVADMSPAQRIGEEYAAERMGLITSRFDPLRPHYIRITYAGAYAGAQHALYVLDSTQAEPGRPRTKSSGEHAAYTVFGFCSCGSTLNMRTTAIIAEAYGVSVNYEDLRTGERISIDV